MEGIHVNEIVVIVHLCEKTVVDHVPDQGIERVIRDVWCEIVRSILVQIMIIVMIIEVKRLVLAVSLFLSQRVMFQKAVDKF